MVTLFFPLILLSYINLSERLTKVLTVSSFIATVTPIETVTLTSVPKYCKVLVSIKNLIFQKDILSVLDLLLQILQ